MIMKISTPRLLVTKLVVLAGLICLMGSSVLADSTYVSYNGQFHLTYPDSWGVVNYTTANFYLSGGDPNAELDYDAVFAERASPLLYQGQYMVLKVDTCGNLTSSQIDSVMEEQARIHERPISEVDADDFLTRSDQSVVFVDRENRFFSIEAEVPGDESGPKTNLVVMKFYEVGVAEFHFYAPAREFEASLFYFCSRKSQGFEQGIPFIRRKLAEHLQLLLRRQVIGSRHHARRCGSKNQQ